MFQIFRTSFVQFVCIVLVTGIGHPSMTKPQVIQKDQPKSFLQRRSQHEHKKPLIAVQLHLVEPGMMDVGDISTASSSLVQEGGNEGRVNPAVLIDNIDKSERKEHVALEGATQELGKLYAKLGHLINGDSHNFTTSCDMSCRSGMWAQTSTAFRKMLAAFIAVVLGDPVANVVRHCGVSKKTVTSFAGLDGEIFNLSNSTDRQHHSYGYVQSDVTASGRRKCYRGKRQRQSCSLWVQTVAGIDPDNGKDGCLTHECP
ncbi:hypothetical protein Pmar_PMAR009406 [Perkinsus marinus ATCC 50983]|uniref:Uncharacterized protein n=1 Tax=Perkinsus marinus (strain ATCC 50983 / TXsc) TaxID=423536 RepID=C5KL04_PERM5|nr:hypothetical protein Pmar_PMAR009406 [Perkinsus marinus ATCC 50983]EER14812.1 hypothetical protein Pmar_PMAR009406 [Perkinsus marinus ATCC 50983]|eukprot:XP_002783016.1 hypothetical protein Pmar_PMAR009406 [Perkinsus marinus ATCC 50983]